MLDNMVGRQMRRWELDNRMKQRFERDASAADTEAPVITVSRQLGSGGTSIAMLVAKQLDFVLYDKEIIDRVAEHAGASPELMEQHDERRRNIVSSLVLQLLEGKRPTEDSYLRALVRAIRKIDAEGDAVVVGRAASCILPESFRARIVAPESLRIARIGELHNIDQDAARRMVVSSDRVRSDFERASFGADLDDPLGYDIVINTEYFSIEHAADLVVTGFARRREGS